MEVGALSSGACSKYKRRASAGRKRQRTARAHNSTAPRAPKLATAEQDMRRQDATAAAVEQQAAKSAPAATPGPAEELTCQHARTTPQAVEVSVAFERRVVSSRTCCAARQMLLLGQISVLFVRSSLYRRSNLRLGICFCRCPPRYNSSARQPRRYNSVAANRRFPR